MYRDVDNVDNTINTITLVCSPPSDITLPDGLSGKVDYTPDLEFSDQDKFTYTVQDDCFAISNEATLTITINLPTPGSTLTISTVTF